MGLFRIGRGLGIIGGIRFDSSKNAQTFEGLGPIAIAQAIFDPSGDSSKRPIATYGLGAFIPAKAIVVGGFMQVLTGFTSAGGNTGTVAISVESAGDVSAAAAVSGAPWSTTGLKAIVPKANTPESTGVALTAARQIAAAVAVQALTAGKVLVTVYYVMGR